MNSATAVRWTAPGFAAPAASSIAMPTVEELEAIEQSAHAEGYARGHAEGIAAGQAEIRRMMAQIEGILDSFTRPLARLDGEVAEALGDLSVKIAGALLGRAYIADPTLLADLVREALDAVGTSQHEVELRLHADDMNVLAPHLTGMEGVRLISDSTIARGELRLHSESVRIDGTLAARLRSCLDAVTANVNAEGPGA